MAVQDRAVEPEVDGGTLSLKLEKPTPMVLATPGFDGISGFVDEWIRPLESGRRYRFLLELEGCQTEEARFDRIETNCQCGRANFTDSAFRSGKVLTGELVWQVPGSSRTGHAAVTLSFRSGKTIVAEVRLMAYLSGMIDVGLEAVGRTRADGFSEWEVPLLVTSPLTLGGLTAALSPELEGFTVQLEESRLTDDDEHRLKGKDHVVRIERGIARIMGHESIVGNRFRFGRLLLSSSDQPGRGWIKDLALSIRPALQISPLRLEFRRRNTDGSPPAEASEGVPKTDPLSAIALVQIDNRLMGSLSAIRPDSAPVDGQQAPPPTVPQLLESGRLQIRLRLETADGDEVPLARLDVKHLGRQVLRVEAGIDGAQFRQRSMTGHWHVLVDDREFILPVDAIVDRQGSGPE